MIELLRCRWAEMFRPQPRSFALAPRQSERLLQRPLHGFVWYMMLYSDNPDVAIKASLDGAVQLPALSPRDLYAVGCIGYTCVVADVTRYDDAARVYVGVVRGPIPVNGMLTVDAVNEGANPASGYVVGAILECPERTL